ncbi:hypothetical protein L0F63_001284 [Massospora cicadina]|nr:hypothetical protein L0F63_001284 [Massospora cicadina]
MSKVQELKSAQEKPRRRNKRREQRYFSTTRVNVTAEIETSIPEQAYSVYDGAINTKARAERWSVKEKNDEKVCFLALLNL